MNLRSRIDDPKIHRFISHGEVRKILEERFHRRLEKRSGLGDTDGEIELAYAAAMAHGGLQAR